MLMSHIARNPFAQPTAISVAESQVTQVHTVFGTQALNAGSSNFTVHNISRRYTQVMNVGNMP